jgi:predicted AlkP superfamily pyrophosphatase or phosphodiesterase
MQPAPAPVLIVDIVGLTLDLVRRHAPGLNEFAGSGAAAPMSSVLPAVTCSAQATMLTGLSPREHGAVGNGWFDRETGEVALWRQSNALVRGKKLYERARELDPSFTCAKLFWWWNLGAAVDWSITPRPFYPADGRKLPATYTWPTSFGIELERELGPFPFFDFWGPRSGLPSSRWIADAAIWTLAHRRPALTLAYLPHLDYSHQRFGPDDPRSIAAVKEIDAVFSDLRAAAAERGVAIIVVSEYGLEAVDTPVHVNRALRREGLLSVRETPAGEVLDTFGSRAFAVADHQLAHVYAKDRAACEQARDLLADLPGVELVLEASGQRAHEIDHARSGDLVLVARKGAWFAYPYWLDDELAPDFARTVDIHRKPGYDPCELFLDPGLRWPKLRIASRLLRKALGMRYLMDVIPLDATLVRGSHGRLPEAPQRGPVFLSSVPFERCGGEPTGGVVDMRSISERALAILSGQSSREPRSRDAIEAT